MLRRRAALPDKEFADAEYGSYQGHMANVMMMGTLIFGFCVTGTFLSVTFTGGEPYINNGYLVHFVRSGLRATTLALFATVIAFVFSTRAASRYLAAGAIPALRVIYKTIFFIGLAEIMVYASLIEFMNSVRDYARMNYMGPQLCPQQAPDDDAVLWSNSSFCAQLGDDFYGGASDVCGMPRSVSFDGDVCTADSRKEGDAEPFVLCSIFDCYTKTARDNRTSMYGGWGNWWFGWDDGMASEYGYKGLANTHGVNLREGWNRVAKEAGEAKCMKAKAEALMNSACNLGTSTQPPSQATGDANDNATTAPVVSPSSTPAEVSACAEARSTYFQADNCAGGAQDDALKCRKVCQWFYDEATKREVPLKSVMGTELDSDFKIMDWVMCAVVFFRGISNLVLAWRCCRSLCASTEHGSILWVLDIFGLFDTSTLTEPSDPSDWIEMEGASSS